jgi:hypothetical protein
MPITTSTFTATNISPAMPQIYLLISKYVCQLCGSTTLSGFYGYGRFLSTKPFSFSHS